MIKDIAQGRTKRALGSGSSGSDDYPVRDLAVGDEVVGTYVGSSTFPSKFNADKSVSYHRFDGADGEHFALRSKGDLDDMMAEAEEGMLLSIERFPDKKTKSGYNFAQYGVSELV